MAARLTDKQKKKIIAEYVQLGSYNAVSKINGVSATTVKNIVLKSADIVEKCEQKKEQNTADILEHMGNKKDKICDIIDTGLEVLPGKIRDAKTASEITTALGTLIDKWVSIEKSTPSVDSGPFEIPARLIAPTFLPVHLDILDHDHSEYVEKGGRGSTKSSFVSLEIVALIKNNPQIHALCCRKVGNTLRDSVYAQIQWAIETLGLADEFDSTKSPLEITYKPTGQKIYFRGADDPHKLKSVKPKFGYIGILWFEELDQFAGDEECRNIQQSAIRGGDEAYIFKSFNPPITRDNWANRYCEAEKESCLVTHSDYTTVPKKWLGKPFLEEAEHLRLTDERAYQHEYMGEPTGTGGNVFEKLELREITDKEIAVFDRIYQGLDFGWFPDPLAFIRLHYDRARETIYLLDEIYENKLPNETAAQKIKDKGYTDAYVTCDSAEPKSVADLRACGLPAKEAIKGPGSIDYGMKWLQKRKIVIDIRRTPNAYEEFVHYEYERDKNGEFISGYPDANNHLIDATRYALERIFRRMGVTA